MDLRVARPSVLVTPAPRALGKESRAVRQAARSPWRRTERKGHVQHSRRSTSTFGVGTRAASKRASDAYGKRP